MRFLFTSFLIMVLVSSFGAADTAVPATLCDDHNLFRGDGDDIDIDFENGSLIIENENLDETVEITAEYRLLVNGRKVKLDRSGKKLARAYYRRFRGIMEEAADIGEEGGKLGAEAAEFSRIVIRKVLKSLKDGDEEEDIDDEIEKEAEERFEKRAERLEKRAEKLEEEVEGLEQLHQKLRGNVRELDELGWF
jgi:hypothetical protein